MTSQMQPEEMHLNQSPAVYFSCVSKGITESAAPAITVMICRYEPKRRQ